MCVCVRERERDPHTDCFVVSLLFSVVGWLGFMVHQPFFSVARYARCFNIHKSMLFSLCSGK